MISNDDKQYGYFAVDRQMLDHPLLQRAEWFRAWQWLIGRAAWKVRADKLAAGIVEVERGQLAVTMRGLAETWNWPLSNVVYFVKRLKRAEMLDYSHIRTKSRTDSGTKSSWGATIITICNYNKFQRAMKVSHGGVAQTVVQTSAQTQPQLFDLVMESMGQEYKPQQTIDRESGGKKLKRMPPHLTTSADGKWLWCTHGTREWLEYDADFQEVRGAACPPKLYADGAGNWFCKAGESCRPKEKARRRA